MTCCARVFVQTAETHIGHSASETETPRRLDAARWRPPSLSTLGAPPHKKVFVSFCKCYSSLAVVADIHQCGYTTLLFTAH